MSSGSDFETAVEQLYRAPHDEFVAERKRLAGELKAAGDKAGALRVAKLARPPLSAWVVNQLFWEERAMFDALLAAGARLRKGELDATPAHRDAITRLRARAGELLQAGGHAVSDAVLRRVATTLSALAATGSFDPDPPGALGADRDPPGFDAMAAAAFAPAAVSPPQSAAREVPEASPAEQHRRRAQEQEREREHQRAEAERLRVAERQRVEAALRMATTELETRKLELARAREALATAERKLEEARVTATAIEASLSKLESSQ